MSTSGSKETFGTLLRAEREKAGKSMGALARHLGVSVPYLCDVELENRAPLSATNIAKAAEFLGINASKLELAAVLCRPSARLRVPNSSTGQSAVTALMRHSLDLSDEAWEKINQIVSADEGGKGK